MARGADRLADAVAALRTAADPSRRPGMARVGIDVSHALGVSVPNIRRIARHLGVDHRLALDLWNTGIHEARLLAVLVADPSELSAAEREAWVAAITSWDLCDAGADLFGRAPAPERIIRSWARRPEPYVKRCAFSMIARAAVREKDWPDARLARLLPVIRRGAPDERNEVRTGVSWALRQVGKRSLGLRQLAIAEAEGLLSSSSRGARWVARDAFRELRDPSTVARLRRADS